MRTYGIVPGRRPTFAAALGGRLFHSWSCWLRYSLCCRAKERRTRARAEKRWRRRRTRKRDRAAEPCRARQCWRCSCERLLSPLWAREREQAGCGRLQAAPRGSRLRTRPAGSRSALHLLFGRAEGTANSSLVKMAAPLQSDLFVCVGGEPQHSDSRSFPPLATPREATLTLARP